MKSLILYATKHGASGKIAELIAGQLEGEIDIVNIKNIKSKNLKLELYDNIILGGSLYAGKVQKELVNYIKENKNVISTKKYSVYLSGGDKSQKIFTLNFEKDFLDGAKITRNLGYIYNFQKMNFLEKVVIRLVAKKSITEENIDMIAIKELAAIHNDN